MTYNEKYDAMPLRGKISPGAWEELNLGHNCYGEGTRRYKRKLCRHRDPYKNWWSDYTIGLAWSYRGPHVTKGKKPKTWRDYN